MATVTRDFNFIPGPEKPQRAENVCHCGRPATATVRFRSEFGNAVKASRKCADHATTAETSKRFISRQDD